MTVLNAFDCELTANSLAIHCCNNATINAELSNVDFLLNKWDGENGLTIEIPCWEYGTPDSVNIPVSVRMGKGTVNEIWVPAAALSSPQAIHAWVWGEDLADRSQSYRIRVQDWLKEIRTQICKGVAA